MDHLSSMNSARLLPEDGYRGTLVGRVWRPGIGRSVVAVREDGLFDISATCSTVSGLAATDDPARVVKTAQGERIGSLEEIAAIPISAVDGMPIRIRDVAKVGLGHAIRRGGTTANGRGEVVLGLAFALIANYAGHLTQAPLDDPFRSHAWEHPRRSQRPGA